MLRIEELFFECEELDPSVPLYTRQKSVLSILGMLSLSADIDIYPTLRTDVALCAKVFNVLCTLVNDSNAMLAMSGVACITHLMMQGCKPPHGSAEGSNIAFNLLDASPREDVVSDAP